MTAWREQQIFRPQLSRTVKNVLYLRFADKTNCAQYVIMKYARNFIFYYYYNARVLGASKIVKSSSLPGVFFFFLDYRFCQNTLSFIFVRTAFVTQVEEVQWKFEFFSQNEAIKKYGYPP